MEKEIGDADTQKHSFILDTVSSNGKVDQNEQYLSAEKRKEIDYNYALFGLNSQGSTANNASFKMYYCKMTENNALIRYFIPCIDNEGSACMYDTVSKKCFYNKGTEDFRYEQ